MAKYTVDYSSTTGYGWVKDFERIEAVDSIVDEFRHNKYTRLTVWDNEHRDFIYWKDAFEREPYIDLLGDIFRDLRTTTRQIKRAQKEG